jgi:hypothetical protein
MKAIFIEVVKRSCQVHLESGEYIEFASYPAEVSTDDIKWNWAELEAKYGKLDGIGSYKVYNTPSGKAEPGCIFWADWYPENMYWDNQKGPHLMAVLPNGWTWNIDSRASNCGLPNDRLHRCWCRHGEVPNITVDKIGLTCNAGAGSIQGGDWHGFLRNGEFIIA